ncbi:beta-1,3-galactosyltransferase 1-like isoform X2 [Asterias amurensis]|uniref:beta-1,3-galactosyltransferase 1-like isoform X2 n=1 Tax=Asterias amurensis TaxID=7602 RepID=UPI003AB65A53
MESTPVELDTVEYIIVVTYRKLQNFLSDLCHNVAALTSLLHSLSKDHSRRGIFQFRPRLKLLMSLLILETLIFLLYVILTGEVNGILAREQSPVTVRDMTKLSKAEHRHRYVEHLLRYGKPPVIKKAELVTKHIVYEPPRTEPPRTEPLIIGEGEHVHPHDFNLVLDEPSICYDELGSPLDVFLVVLVTTTHENAAKRQAIRETWGSPKEVLGKNIITLFLLASTRANYLQARVEEESKTHHDIIQEDFKDSYKNLTLKTVMALKWTTTHCSHASYVMKTDDDMYVVYHNLVKYLALDTTRTSRLAFGFVINGSPIRDPSSKWYMPRSVYSANSYPPFMSGTGYVLSRDVAISVYKQSLDTKFLYLEDVFVAICLSKLHIRPIHNSNFNNWRTDFYTSSCRFHNLVTTHMVLPAEMYSLWNTHQRLRRSGERCQW